MTAASSAVGPSESGGFDDIRLISLSLNRSAVVAEDSVSLLPDPGLEVSVVHPTNIASRMMRSAPKQNLLLTLFPSLSMAFPILDNLPHVTFNISNDRYFSSMFTCWITRAP